MRRANREITSLEEIEQVLQEAQVCRLAMVDEEGMPYIVPLNYGYKDNVLYFHCAREGRKLDILKKNNRVCFEVDIDMVIVGGEKACNYTAKYKSVIGIGKAYFVDDHEGMKAGLDVLMAQYVKSGPTTFEYDQKNMSHIFVMKVVIDEMTGKKSGY